MGQAVEEVAALVRVFYETSLWFCLGQFAVVVVDFSFVAFVKDF